jgi:hypothetical protein
MMIISHYRLGGCTDPQRQYNQYFQPKPAILVSPHQYKSHEESALQEKLSSHSCSSFFPESKQSDHRRNARKAAIADNCPNRPTAQRGGGSLRFQVRRCMGIDLKTRRRIQANITARLTRHTSATGAPVAVERRQYQRKQTAHSKGNPSQLQKMG